MEHLSVDDEVQLTRDIPELDLRRGDVGRVLSIWGCAIVAYEVEFPGLVWRDERRTLLLPHQLTRYLAPPREVVAQNVSTAPPRESRSDANRVTQTEQAC